MEKEKYNKTGMIFFIAAFIAAILVIGFSVYYNPGPIDQKGGKTVALGISHDEIVAREKTWRTSTPEIIARGKDLYAANCVFCHAQGGQDVVADRFSKGSSKYGAKETDIYRIIFRGIPALKPGDAPIKAALSHIPAESRWALVHYLRSLSSGSPSASSGDWASLDKEAIW